MASAIYYLSDLADTEFQALLEPETRHCGQFAGIDRDIYNHRAGCRQSARHCLTQLVWDMTSLGQELGSAVDPAEWNERLFCVAVAEKSGHYRSDRSAALGQTAAKFLLFRYD